MRDIAERKEGYGCGLIRNSTQNEIGSEIMCLNIKYIICKFRGYHVLDSTGMCVVCGKDRFGNGEELILNIKARNGYRI